MNQWNITFIWLNLCSSDDYVILWLHLSRLLRQIPKDLIIHTSAVCSKPMYCDELLGEKNWLCWFLIFSALKCCVTSERKVFVEKGLLDTPTVFTYIRVTYCPNIQVFIIIGVLKVHNKMESFSQRTRLRLNFANLTQIQSFQLINWGWSASKNQTLMYSVFSMCCSGGWQLTQRRVLVWERCLRYRHI